MYIHRIRSGVKTTFLKLLLRESYRVGSKVKQRTLANLSAWNNEDIELLERALKARRLPTPDALQIAAAEAQIFRLFAGRQFPSKPGAAFQIFASLRRPHGTNPMTGLPPTLGKGNLRVRKYKVGARFFSHNGRICDRSNGDMTMSNDPSEQRRSHLVTDLNREAKQLLSQIENLRLHGSKSALKRLAVLENKLHELRKSQAHGICESLLVELKKELEELEAATKADSES